MKNLASRWPSLVAFTVSLGIVACSSESSEGADEPAAAEAPGEHAAAETPSAEMGSEGREGEGEHARSEGGGEEGEGEHGEAGGHDEEGGEGEESGVYIAMGGTWDYTRRGARLVMKYDPAAAAFVGTVENTTEGMLCAVRVEVHLSTRVELGPTERMDVAPGRKIDVRLPAEGRVFDTWTAHPEVSGCSG